MTVQGESGSPLGGALASVARAVILGPMSDLAWTTHRLDASDTDTQSLLDHEWLVTNGTGAYAAGTAAGCPTRRYHGLFIAATRPPVGRVVLLNQMWEQLVLDGQPLAVGAVGASTDRQPVSTATQVLEFSTCLFRANNAAGQLFAPNGQRMLKYFERGLSIRWTYGWGPIRFTRELFLHWKRQAVTLQYSISGLAEAGCTGSLKLAPMLTMRDFHGLMYRAGNPAFDFRSQQDTLTVTLGDLAATFHCPGSRFIPNSDWWYGVFYPLDAERGQADHEDYFVPGSFEVPLPADEGGTLTLSVALGNQPADPHPDNAHRAAHLTPVLSHLESEHSGPESRILAIATDDFVVDRTIGERKLSTVLAGYPWFADWGRDTFIALPGILLCTGRYQEAASVLRVFASAVRQGLVPNRFDDYDDLAAHYNTVDASLWFVRAAIAYVDTSGDSDAWNNWLAEACVTICDAYIRGTDYGIRMAGDGLIEAGSSQTQLTWMDAKCGEEAFTPRFGKAVEINALWHHALVGLAKTLPSRYRDKAVHFEKLCGRIRRAFAGIFWRGDEMGLYDHVWVDDAGKRHADVAIRPNQILVAALPHSPLPRTRLVQVVDAVRRHLLTPFGLRTLSPEDANYHCRYTGGQFQRDSAYHQGTIWPWLMGPYAEAVLRVGRFSHESKIEALEAIRPLCERLEGHGCGHVGEIHEAMAPHRPVGCFAQAWSAGEILRVLRLINS